MKSAITFDLSLSEDGKFYDIFFKEEQIEEEILKEVTNFKNVKNVKNVKNDKNEKLIQITENPLMEECEDLEECEDTSFFNEDFSDEEDTSIILVYEGVNYVAFSGMKSVYTEKDLSYVGDIGNGENSIDFILTG